MDAAGQLQLHISHLPLPRFDIPSPRIHLPFHPTSHPSQAAFPFIRPSNRPHAQGLTSGILDDCTDLQITSYGPPPYLSNTIELDVDRRLQVFDAHHVDNFSGWHDPLYQSTGASEVPLLVEEFISALLICRDNKDYLRAKLLYAYICSQGLEDHVAVGNHIVPTLVRCGKVEEAQQVFLKLPNQNEHAWTSLISGFSECGQLHLALRLQQRMCDLYVTPTSHTYVSLLKGCSINKGFRQGQEIHNQIVQMGYEKHSIVGNTLVGMYANCGLLLDAQETFDHLGVQDSVSFNALIAGYAEHGPFEEALAIFEQMSSRAVHATDGTFVSILKAYANLSDIEMGRNTHVELIENGFEMDLYVGNSLVGMYAKVGSMPEAYRIFSRLPVQDVVSWTALVAGYAEHGPSVEALKIFERMQAVGVPPNDVTFVSILKACGSLAVLNKGREIHVQISEKGLMNSLSICNSLIYMYAACGAIREAHKVFESMLNRNVITWSTMIKGFGMNHMGNSAMQCFEDMLHDKVKPNAIIFSSLLKACDCRSSVFKGYEYFRMMKKYDISPTIEHYTCMVSMLAKAGFLYETERFLESLCPLGEEAWTALLAACRTYGEAELGWRCFQELICLKPRESSSYLLMIDICGNSSCYYDIGVQIESLRKHAGALNGPGIASIEVNNNSYEFIGGNNYSREISGMMEAMNMRIKEGGHIPNLDLVLGPPYDEEEKETAMCKHAERFALAFGLVHMPQGETIRVTKNLRMCNDCHNVGKLISKVEGRVIVIKDDCCIHHFKDGFCECGDMF